MSSAYPSVDGRNHDLDEHLPEPLCQLLHLYNAEDRGFRKVHRLIDTFEWAIKWHTLLAVSDLMRETALTPALKVLFASGLRIPSLGIWLQFYRESIAHIRRPLVPYGEWDRLLPLEIAGTTLTGARLNRWQNDVVVLTLDSLV